MTAQILRELCALWHDVTEDKFISKKQTIRKLTVKLLDNAKAHYAMWVMSSTVQPVQRALEQLEMTVVIAQEEGGGGV